MHGVFPNVDWSNALDPGLDEDTQRLEREQKRRKWMNRLHPPQGIDEENADGDAADGSDGAPGGGGDAGAVREDDSDDDDDDGGEDEDDGEDDDGDEDDDQDESGDDADDMGEDSQRFIPHSRDARGIRGVITRRDPTGVGQRGRKQTKSSRRTDDSGSKPAPINVLGVRPIEPSSDFLNWPFSDIPDIKRLRSIVQPPSLSFQLENKQFFVLKGIFDARGAEFGHYIRPFKVTREFLAIPFPKPSMLVVQEDWKRLAIIGSPGVRMPPPDGVPDSWGWIAPPLTDYYNLVDRTANLALLRENPALLFPGTSGDSEPNVPPHPEYSLEGRDFVRRDWVNQEDARFYEIGRATLEAALETAEQMDLAFARRMQGLLGVPLVTVWDCLDPAFNPADRQDLMSQFLSSYGKDFYSQVRFDEGTEARAVATEALQQHSAFCQEWVHKHYRALAPLVTSAAESLVSTFSNDLKSSMSRDFPLTVTQMTRIFMRDPELSVIFASALQSQMGAMDMLRPNRNPNYRQMHMLKDEQVRAYNKAMENINAIQTRVRKLMRGINTLHAYHFNPLVVDWHQIVGQLPMAHKHYQRGAENLAMRFRATSAWNPPWEADPLV